MSVFSQECFNYRHVSLTVALYSPRLSLYLSLSRTRSLSLSYYSVRSSEIQAPVGPNRDLYATCQFSTLEEAIRVRLIAVLVF